MSPEEKLDALSQALMIKATELIMSLMKTQMTSSSTLHAIKTCTDAKQEEELIKELFDMSMNIHSSKARVEDIIEYLSIIDPELAKQFEEAEVKG